MDVVYIGNFFNRIFGIILQVCWNLYDIDFEVIEYIYRRFWDSFYLLNYFIS